MNDVVEKLKRIDEADGLTELSAIVEATWMLHDKPVEQQLAVAVLGFCEEVSEYHMANSEYYRTTDKTKEEELALELALELGDVLYYASLVCSLTNTHHMQTRGTVLSVGFSLDAVDKDAYLTYTAGITKKILGGGTNKTDRQLHVELVEMVSSIAAVRLSDFFDGWYDDLNTRVKTINRVLRDKLISRFGTTD